MQVALPSLKYLRLSTEDALAAVAFMRHLQCPSSVRLKLSTSLFVPHSDPFSEIVWRDDNADGGGVTLIAWRDIRDVDSMRRNIRWDGDSDVTLSFSFSGIMQHRSEISDEQFNKTMATSYDLVSALPFSEVHSLIIHTVSSQFRYTLDACRQMDDLHTLTVLGNKDDGVTGTDLMKLLESTSTTDDEDEKSIFPNLSTLRVEGIDLDGSFPRLKELLRARRDSGHPLEVNICGCYNVTTADVDSLKEVSRVDWDSVEMVKTNEAHAA